MKKTLKRELKVFEIVESEAFEVSVCPCFQFLLFLFNFSFFFFILKKEKIEKEDK
jgi:hypothetical protein